MRDDKLKIIVVIMILSTAFHIYFHRIWRNDNTKQCFIVNQNRRA